DLRALWRIKTSIAAEKERLTEGRLAQAEEKQSLTLLLEEKRRIHAEAEARMEDERAQAEELAAHAEGLQDLIASLEKESESLREELEAREQAGEVSLLAQTLPFSRRAGLVSLPVVGDFSKRSGEDDCTGSQLKGDLLRTQSGAIV